MKLLLRWLSVIGLSVQLIGSAILVFYGTAGHIATGGHALILGADVEPGVKEAAALRSDNLHAFLNGFGFFLIFIGTAAQIGDGVAKVKQTSLGRSRVHDAPSD